MTSKPLSDVFGCKNKMKRGSWGQWGVGEFHIYSCPCVLTPITYLFSLMTLLPSSDIALTTSLYRWVLHLKSFLSANSSYLKIFIILSQVFNSYNSFQVPFFIKYIFIFNLNINVHEIISSRTLFEFPCDFFG